MSRLLFLLFILVPLQASAHIYKLDYAGQITQIHLGTLGYAVGDSISGSLTIDLTNVVDVSTEWDGESTAIFESPTGENFIKGYHDPNEPNNIDVFGITDDLGGVPNDVIYVLERRLLGNANSSLVFSLVLFLDGNTYSGLSIEDLKFSHSDLRAGTWGSITRSIYDEASGIEYWDDASFNIAHLKISKVPEPSALILIFIGFTSVFFIRVLKPQN